MRGGNFLVIDQLPMRLRLQTRVAGTPPAIMARFDEALFRQLSPPGIKVELLQFDGSKTGDRVHIRLHLPLFQAHDWISDIVEHGSDNTKSWFVDQGSTLPWFLSFWRHQHIVRLADNGSEIIDDIEFKGPAWLPDFLLVPVLWLQFAWRKPIYRKVFGVVGR